MGALEYEPVTPDPDPLPERIDLDGVAEEAWRTLNEDPLPVETLRTLMALNGSSCGARPKIMVRCPATGGSSCRRRRRARPPAPRRSRARRLWPKSGRER